ncbi:MAG: site-specific DNA-methyltransferase [Chloroflexi bacterium]|nr:site-specific DNA-methyltransferase [Chloroflexota bacterium]
MSFNVKLIDLLKTDHNLVDDEGELLLAAVQDRAWKIDHDLVKLLLSDEEIKAKFFDEIEKHWIFNVNTFLDYISQKNFLDNSYTRFKNRIGLTIDGKYLRERGDVSLVWPYKDTILEGGQTKEEEKRKEIFFNEVLAQDEISRLLDPKVLTNFTRYTARGKEKVKDFKRDENGVIRENLILKGNNLLALHTLKTQFRGQVKLIYIDPPYNTGGDTFGYNDNFNHSSWLTFMKNRLEIAREILSSDGSIWINIGDDESHYLKVVCDDVFGRESYVTNVVWRSTDNSNNDVKQFSVDHNSILVYSKNPDWTTNRLVPTDAQTSHFKNPDNDPRGPHFDGNPISSPHYRANLVYDVKSPQGKIIKPPKNGWRWSKAKMKEKIESGEIRFSKDGSRLFRRTYLRELKGLPPSSLWADLDVTGHNRQAKYEQKNLFPEAEKEDWFQTPKPEKLIKYIFDIATKEGDLVLDFFMGSGTTAAVAHKMQRQYIAVEQMDYIEVITIPRLLRVVGSTATKKGKMFEEIDFDQGGISESVGWKSGGDFIYCEMMKYNEAFMERIQAAENSKVLLKIWQEMAEGSFLNWYVNPEVPEEAAKDFEALGKEDGGFEKQKHLLASLLDKNQLYVNYSEMDDALFKVSKEDKELNRKFYG